MNAISLQRTETENARVTVCFGIDPYIERFTSADREVTPDDLAQSIYRYYVALLDAMREHDVAPDWVKPNIAYFEQLGLSGLTLLERFLSYLRSHSMPILLDAKRGDIGRTSDAYARAIFDAWNADATTVSPWMGQDSIAPFFNYTNRGKLVFVLCRTSNQGARDLQELSFDNRPLYLHLADLVSGPWYREGIGLVIGGNDLVSLENIVSLLMSKGKPLPLLIPGIGTQGGDLSGIVALLTKHRYPLRLAICSASSSVAFADTSRGTDPTIAAVDAMKRLFDEAIA